MGHLGLDAWNLTLQRKWTCSYREPCRVKKGSKHRWTLNGCFRRGTLFCIETSMLRVDTVSGLLLAPHSDMNWIGITGCFAQIPSDHSTEAGLF